MAYLHVTNCAKRSVLVCLVTMLVFLLRLYGDSLGWDLLKITYSCAFGLAGYLSNEKESACEGAEVAWFLVVARGRL